MRRAGETARWGLRGLLACAVAALMTIGVLRTVDLLTLVYPPVQGDALRALYNTSEEAAAAKPGPLRLVYFGDSLSQPEDMSRAADAIPPRLRAHIGAALGKAGLGNEQDVQLVPFVYSGLSQWSLYYIADRMVALRPDLAVIEFNLYNFGPFWRGRERKILAALLDLRRLPEVLTLPTSAAGLATDEWIFHNLLLNSGLLPRWHTIQREQARCAESYWSLADKAQQILGFPELAIRSQNRIFDLADKRQPDRKRATPGYARLLLGKALTGVAEDDAALRVLDAAVRRFVSAGIDTLVFIPPYNVEHLKSLGLLEGAHYEDAIAHVGAVAERAGAKFLDLHAMFPDEYFRDFMDHLKESDQTKGHDKVAERLAAALADDSRRIVAKHR